MVPSSPVGQAVNLPEQGFVTSHYLWSAFGGLQVSTLVHQEVFTWSLSRKPPRPRALKGDASDGNDCWTRCAALRNRRSCQPPAWSGTLGRVPTDSRRRTANHRCRPTAPRTARGLPCLCRGAIGPGGVRQLSTTKGSGLTGDIPMCRGVPPAGLWQLRAQAAQSSAITVVGELVPMRRRRLLCVPRPTKRSGQGRLLAAPTCRRGVGAGVGDASARGGPITVTLCGVYAPIGGRVKVRIENLPTVAVEKFPPPMSKRPEGDHPDHPYAGTFPQRRHVSACIARDGGRR